MANFRIPNKKPRLEETYDDWDCSMTGNDDLWGQTELTAEEFDMLEVQATQKVSCSKPSDSRHHSHSREASTSDQNNPSCSKKENCKRETAKSERNKAYSGRNVPDPEELKQQQYALEGQVNFLQESLNKAIKDLTDERLNREQVIGEKIEQFKNKEQVMQEEMDKIQTALQFKEQEMKNVYSKVNLLELKVKEKIKDSDSQLSLQQTGFSPSKKAPNKFLNRFNFESTKDVRTNDASVQTIEKSENKNIHLLSLHTKRGEPKGADIVSNLLSNRLENSNSRGYSPHLNFSYGKSSGVAPTNEFESSLWSLARLNAGQQTEELWECYELSLREHIAFLQNDVIVHSKLLTQTTSRTANRVQELTNLQSSSSPPSSSPTNDVDTRHSSIISCLKDLTELLSWQCPIENTSSKTTSKGENEKTFSYRNEIDFTACSNPLFTCEDERMDTTHQSVPGLQELLIMLTKPDTYPEGYCKEDEIMHALSALTAWSSKSPVSLEPYLYDFHPYVLLSGQLGVKSAYLTLQLLCNMITLGSFLSSLMHRIDGCIFSGIGNLCQSDILTSNDDVASVVIIQVEDFLCEVFAVLGFSVINEDNCSCSSKLIQSFIIMLWRHYQTYFRNFSCLQFNALKKGLIVLLQMSTHVRHFREKRVHVEDNYVTLICGLSRLCKENCKIKELQDTIHDLWDFQDDSGEFDIDDQLSTCPQASTSYDNLN